jgi:HrpA-like RNA helicase
MLLPTLKRPGYLVPPKDMSDSNKRKLENVIAIDYISNFISDRIPRSKTVKMRISPKNYGDKVIILKSDTGSGKSTILPSSLYNAFFERTRRNIMVTQPRILTAIDIPSIIIKHYSNFKLDKNIGYNTGVFKRVPIENGLIFSTIGVLTQQLIMDEDEDFLKRYQFIIIDEVHERDIDTDLCLFHLKKLIEKYYNDPLCPLIILTSATLDENVFIKYFDVPEQNFIQVIGSTFSIQENFPDYSVANYLEYAFLKIQKLHISNLEELQTDTKSRDIIVFVKNNNDAQKIYDKLLIFNSTILTKDYDSLMKYHDEFDGEIEKLYKKGGDVTNMNKQYYILPIMLNSKNFQKGGLEYQNLFSNLESISVPMWKDDGHIDIKKLPYNYVIPTRRVIVSTNIAETGVTIPTLKYCVDTGYQLSVEFYPNFGCLSLISKNITHSMAVQRKGRVGRMAEGFWYPCYTKETFDNLQKEQMTKIIISDSTDNLLNTLIKQKNVEIVEENSINAIKNYEDNKLFQMYKLMDNSWYKIKNELETNLAALDLIEMPSMQSISYSLEKFHVLGFMDDMYNITALGYFASKIRFISIESKKMIFAGYYYGANILDLITTASFAYIQKIFIFEKTFQLENFLKENDKEFDFYINILIADDFIKNIFIWNTLQDFLYKKLSKEKIIYTDVIKEWCINNKIKHDGLMKVIETRDSLIENIISIGLDPYKNSLNITKNKYNLNKILQNSLEEGIDEITKIKKSVYEGYKCNTLLYNNINNNYLSIFKNIPVKVKSQYIKELNSKIALQTKPIYLIVDSYIFTQKFNSSQFEFVANGFISVLDNYISVDDRFYLN